MHARDEPPLVRGAGGSGAVWFEPGGDRLVVVTRLLARLDGDAPVTLVRAPAGFGKSTLVRLWEATRGATIEWLDDVEVTDELVDDLLARTEGRVVVCASPGLTGLCVSSRAQERLAQHAVCVDGAELLLTDEQVLDLWSGLGLGRQEHLAPTVGGWARLAREVGAALAAAPDAADPRAVAAGVARTLLAPWVEGLPAAEREVLAGLLQPLQLTAGSAGLVLGLGEADSAALLARLVRLGHLSVDEDAVHTWPAAVRTALLELVGGADPAPDEALARWHLARREHDLALDHALLSGSEVVARDVLGRSWLPLIVYRHESLVSFFRAAPPGWFVDPDDYPHGVRQLALIPPGQTEEWARRALDATIPSHLPADARTALNLALVQVFGLRRARRVEEAYAAAQRLFALASQARADDVAEVEDLLASTFLLTGLMHELAGDLSGALEPLRLATERADVSANLGSGRHACAHLAMNLAVLGRVEEAEHWLAAAAAAPVTTGWVTPRARISVWVAEVLLAVGRGDQEAAKVPLRGLLTVRDPLDELWPFVLYARACYSRLWGDRRDEVERLLAEPDVAPGSELEHLLRTALDPR